VVYLTQLVNFYPRKSALTPCNTREHQNPTMAGRFTLRTLSDFAAAHSLREYPGDCQRLHGHNWKVEVEVSASELDELGMVIDFKQVKQATRKATDRLDHQYLNELEPFNQINPTAENIARTLFQEIATTLNDDRVQVDAVTVWETERASARYSDSDSE
jgi:6-pyruvoyltetrahydropterin/6-carboxytetrahydropterin synthase